MNKLLYTILMVAFVASCGGSSSDSPQTEQSEPVDSSSADSASSDASSNTAQSETTSGSSSSESTSPVNQSEPANSSSGDTSSNNTSDSSSLNNTPVNQSEPVDSTPTDNSPSSDTSSNTTSADTTSDSSSSDSTSSDSSSSDASSDTTSSDSTSDSDSSAADSSAFSKNKVSMKSLTVKGTLPKNNIRYATYKGTTPGIIYHANADSSIDIAWHDSSQSAVNITQIDKDGNLINEFALEGVPKLTSLLGFTKIPSDNSYVITYGTTEKYTFKEGNEALVPAGTQRDIGHFYMAKFNSAGKNVWNKHIFGDDHHRKWGSFNPGSSSSGRLAYDKNLDALIYFVGSNRRMGNLSVHQGSTFGVYSTDGDYLTSNAWFVSHDYDMRILLDKGNTYLFGHGDSGPYGLYVAPWKFTKTKNADGTSGFKGEKLIKPFVAVSFANYKTGLKLNVTNYAFGDVVGLGNGEFAAVYTRGKDDFTRRDRGYYDVYFRKLSTNEGRPTIQNFSLNKQLTNVANDKTHNGNANIAKYGDNFIIAWHNNKKPYAYVGEYDVKGNAVVAPQMIDKAMLNSMYGLITLPNGNVFWASSAKDGGSELNLHWIKK